MDAGAPPCDECGFDYDALDPADVPAANRTFAKRHRAPLTRLLHGEDGDGLVRRSVRLMARAVRDQRRAP